MILAVPWMSPALAAGAAGVRLGLPQAVERLGLDEFAAQVLLLALATEIDRRYERIHAPRLLDPYLRRFFCFFCFLGETSATTAPPCLATTR